MKTLLSPVILIVLLATTALAEGSGIRAFVDRTAAQPGESIRLTVINETGKDASVDTSAIQDFRVMTGGTSTNVQIVNGKMSRSASYTYTLIPRKTGRLIIPRLQVKAGKKVYQTDEIRISVSNAPGRKDGREPVYVEAVVSNPSPYEGEQIVYIFRVFHQVQISNARLQAPSFSAFTAEEIGKPKSYQRIIDGKRFDVSEIRYMIIPLQAGKITIEPASLQCRVMKPRQRQRRSAFESFFDDPFFGRGETEARIFETQPLTVQVKPLPAYRQDTPFSGLVGRFTVQTELDHASLTVGDSATLALTVQGTGNIMDAEAPALVIPEGFKTYADNPEEDIELTEAGYAGKRIFRTALVPMKAGEFSLPAVHFIYFDIEKEDYRTVSTRPLSVRVEPAEERDTLETYSPFDPGQRPPVLKKRVRVTGRDILPLNESLDALRHRKSLSFFAFLALILGPCVCYLVCRGILSFVGKETSPSLLMAGKAASALKQAGRDTDDEAFLTCLYHATVSAIRSRAGIVGEALTYAEAEQMLRSTKVSGQIVDQTVSLLSRIESAKFGGSSLDSSSRSRLHKEAKTLIDRLLK